MSRILLPTIGPELQAACGHDDLVSTVVDVIAGLPKQLAWSRVHLSSCVLSALSPLSDDDERRVLREVTSRPWYSGMPSFDGERFRFDGRWPDVIEFGPRIEELEGRPMPLGLRSRWEDLGRQAVVALGRRVFDPAVIGTFDRRGELLIDHGLIPDLKRLGIEMLPTPRGFAGRRTSSDAVAVLKRGGQEVAVNIEGRNRRWEVLDRIPRKHRDRQVFRDNAARLIPTVVVAPRVTKRYRSQVEDITGGLGGVVETGIYLAPSTQVIETLGGWAPWPMVLRLPDDVLELAAAEIESAADRYLAADLGPQIVDPTMMRSEDQELLHVIEEYRHRNPRCVQAEAFKAIAAKRPGISERRLHRVWAKSGRHWTDWSSLLDMVD